MLFCYRQKVKKTFFEEDYNPAPKWMAKQQILREPGIS